MGFAKYMEDNLSRYHGATVVRAREHDRFKQQTATGQPGHSSGQSKQSEAEQKGAKKMKEFTIADARPLPVIVLADVSGSMSENGKIEALNQALREMIRSFAGESKTRTEIQVGLITFGGSSAKLHVPLAPAHQITGMPDLIADGRTPMGLAFTEAKNLLEDQARIPSRAYRPVLILLSDGLPTDDWEQALDALCDSERAKKATRFAMSIGGDANDEMLQRFVNDKESPVFKTHEARDIHRFFRAVTMSVTARTRSVTPNAQVPLMLAPVPEDDLDLDF